MSLIIKVEDAQSVWVVASAVVFLQHVYAVSNHHRRVMSRFIWMRQGSGPVQPVHSIIIKIICINRISFVSACIFVESKQCSIADHTKEFEAMIGVGAIISAWCVKRWRPRGFIVAIVSGQAIICIIPFLVFEQNHLIAHSNDCTARMISARKHRTLWRPC